MSENTTHAVDDPEGGTTFRADGQHPFADVAAKFLATIIEVTERAAAIGLPVVGPGRIECTYSGTHGQILLTRRLDADHVVEITRIDADLAARRETFGGIVVPAPSPDERREPTFH
ncbi:MAG: hypothetical protein KJ061_17330 [Vicinamibacteraceae bacterium]|nr:hypothetical protein [Vicinamibacteraceae bacterium]